MAERLLSWPEMVERFTYAVHPERVCPRCGCCTRALCEAGQQHPSGCIGLTGANDHELRERIAACPCATSE